MGIKSITSLALAAAAVACVSIAPAEAKNNNKALNDLAMQMYMQNQAQSVYGNPYMYTNPNYGYGTNYGYGNAYGTAANGQTPWSAGAMPYAYNGGNYNRGIYNSAIYNRGYLAPRATYNHHHRWWR